MASLLNKRMCLQSALLDELKVIKHLVDFRISAVESKIDLLVATCSSIFNNSEGFFNQNPQQKRYPSLSPGLNKLTEQLIEKVRYIEDMLSTLVVNISTKSCSNCNNNLRVLPLVKGKSSDLYINTGQELKLNSSDDYPDGCWLGDETDFKKRVRVDMDPLVLLHINELCTTPEKMALALVDKLFPRDILAVSNLSGKGRHCKQQLDPLLIYGIKCHLKLKFSLSEEDWLRIRKNIDSKCRTMWRRKKKGLPLVNQKAMSSSSNLMQRNLNDFDSSDDCAEQVICYEMMDSQKSANVTPDEEMPLSACKSPSDDDFPLLPSVQLFTVEATDCFMLQSVMPDGIIKDNRHHDFLAK